MESDRLASSEAHRIIFYHLAQMMPSLRLGPSELHRLVECVEIRAYDPGETVLPPRSEVEFLGLVIAGQVAALNGHGVKGRRTAILLPGHTFGRVSSPASPSGATLQAITTCQVWFLRRADLSLLVSEHGPAFLPVVEQSAIAKGAVCTGAERRIAARQWPSSRALQRAVGARALASESRAGRQSLDWPRLRWAGLALVLVLGFLALMILGLPFARQVLALGAMGVGQLCCDDRHDRCAEGAWNLASSLIPTDANPVLALGTLYASHGDLTSSQRAFETAQSLAPDAPEVDNNLGFVYAQAGDHRRAVAAFRRALDLEPGVAAVERNLASSLHALGAYDEALAHYRAALALGDSRAEILVDMAIAYYQTGQLAQAAEAAREAIGYDAALSPAYTVLGAVALESRHVEEALPYLNRATVLNPANAQAHAYLGLFYEVVDQPARAASALARALSIVQDDDVQAQLHLHLDRVTAKEAVLRSAMEGQPQSR